MYGFIALDNIIYYVNILSIQKTHGFVTRPLNSACVHRVVGLCTLCYQAKQASIIACTHTWMLFSDPKMVGVACDFNLPIHTAAISNNAITHVCTICHAVACSNCFVG